MDVQAPMAKSLRMIFRILATLTLLEGLVGLSGLGFDIFMIPFTLQYMQKMPHAYAHPKPLLFLMVTINLAFDVLLFVAGAFIWKLQRKGLFLLVCTLLAELVYFFGSLLLTIHFEHPHATNLSLLVTAGNMGLGLQILTAYPVVAGIFIFFAYRYLGIPARPLN